jgi:phosphoglycolate phosphatase-like HAD superfamily hydrolase
MSHGTGPRDVLVIDLEVTSAFVIDVGDLALRLAPLRREAWREVTEDTLRRLGREPVLEPPAIERLLSHEISIDAIQALLTTRGVPLPAGVPCDPPARLTAWGLQNLAEIRIRELLAQRVSEVLPTGVLLEQLHEADVPAIAYSESHVRLAVGLLGLERLFGAILDASDAEWLELPPPPAPEALVMACELAGVEPRRVALVTGSSEVAGAARNAGLGLVVGLLCRGAGDLAEENGPTVILEDLERVVLADGPRGAVLA